MSQTVLLYHQGQEPLSQRVQKNPKGGGGGMREQVPTSQGDSLSRQTSSVLSDLCHVQNPSRGACLPPTSSPPYASHYPSASLLGWTSFWGSAWSATTSFSIMSPASTSRKRYLYLPSPMKKLSPSLCVCVYIFPPLMNKRKFPNTAVFYEALTESFQLLLTAPMHLWRERRPFW